MNNKRDLPTGRSAPDDRTGQVQFDDRGNALWETRQGRWLENPSLALADNQPPRDGHVVNSFGLRSGYNPYESGVLGRNAARRKKDLRALSRWIESKKCRGG